MRITRGYVLQRMERLEYTDGTNEGVIVIVRIATEEGIQQYYAKDEFADDIFRKLRVGDFVTFEIQTNEYQEQILNRNVDGQIKFESTII